MLPLIQAEEGHFLKPFPISHVRQPLDHLGELSQVFQCLVWTLSNMSESPLGSPALGPECQMCVASPVQGRILSLLATLCSTAEEEAAGLPCCKGTLLLTAPSSYADPEDV